MAALGLWSFCQLASADFGHERWSGCVASCVYRMKAPSLESIINLLRYHLLDEPSIAEIQSSGNKVLETAHSSLLDLDLMWHL